MTDCSTVFECPAREVRHAASQWPDDHRLLVDVAIDPVRPDIFRDASCDPVVNAASVTVQTDISAHAFSAIVQAAAVISNSIAG